MVVVHVRKPLLKTMDEILAFRGRHVQLAEKKTQAIPEEFPAAVHPVKDVCHPDRKSRFGLAQGLHQRFLPRLQSGPGRGFFLKKEFRLLGCGCGILLFRGVQAKQPAPAA